MLTKDVIRYYRLRLGLTEQQLGDRCGVSRGAVQQWESGATAPTRTRRAQVAAALGITEAELLGMEPPAITTSKVRMSLGGEADVAALREAGAVPLISWRRAATWPNGHPPETESAEAWMPCPVQAGPHAFALRVGGESMHNPTNGPSYASGDVIYVEPSREAQPGDRVVVRMEGQVEATFKQLVVEDGRKMLKALNPEWKPRYAELSEGDVIKGVVLGKWSAD